MVEIPASAQAKAPVLTEIQRTQETQAKESVPETNSSLEFPDKWNLWFKYAIGIPAKDSFKSLSHIQIGFAKPFKRNFEYGLWAGQSSAQVEDHVDFNTGYSETRIYKLTGFIGGLHLQAQATQQISIYANLGYSLTTSDLINVTTTAPINSSLSPSRQEGEVFAPAYNIGINYEHDLKNISFGGSLGISSSSTEENAEIKDTSIGIYIKYRKRDPRALSGSILPTDNPFSDQHRINLIPAVTPAQPPPEPTKQNTESKK